MDSVTTIVAITVITMAMTFAINYGDTTFCVPVKVNNAECMCVERK